jgi:hypothetical protein
MSTRDRRPVSFTVSGGRRASAQTPSDGGQRDDCFRLDHSPVLSSFASYCLLPSLSFLSLGPAHWRVCQEALRSLRHGARCLLASDGADPRIGVVGLLPRTMGVSAHIISHTHVSTARQTIVCVYHAHHITQHTNLHIVTPRIDDAYFHIARNRFRLLYDTHTHIYTTYT